MSRRLVYLLILCAPSAAFAQLAPTQRTNQLMANAERLVAVDADGCLRNAGDSNEIVVCAGFDPNREHRLPFPELAAIPGERRSNPIPNGNPEIIYTGRCHIDQTERNCFKGVGIVTVSFGGPGGRVSGPAGKLWSVVKDPVPDEDYVKQVQIRETTPQ